MALKESNLPTMGGQFSTNQAFSWGEGGQRRGEGEVSHADI